MLGPGERGVSLDWVCFDIIGMGRILVLLGEASVVACIASDVVSTATWGHRRRRWNPRREVTESDPWNRFNIPAVRLLAIGLNWGD